jgi:hypothetical protein
MVSLGVARPPAPACSVARSRFFRDGDQERSTVRPHPEEEHGMSIVDDLVSNLVERNTIRLNGSFTITLVDGGVAVKGQLLSTLHDQKKNKDIVNVTAPIVADVRVGDIVIPLPEIR